MVNWALVIVTLSLAIITFFYMRHTKRMADVMVRDFEVKVTPLIDIQLSKKHSRVGFEIGCKLVNRGFCAIRIQKIVMKWWYQSEPTTPHFPEPEVINEYLYTENSISRTITIRDDEIKNPEFPESQSLNGAHLGKIVAASILVIFYDVNGRVQQTTPKILDPLM